MNDKELYRELEALTKRKADWLAIITYVGLLLENQTTKITAKALWLLGEIHSLGAIRITNKTLKISKSATDNKKQLL